VLGNKTLYFIKLKGNIFSSISEIIYVAGATLAMLLSLLWMIARLCPRVYARAPRIVWSGQNILA
jgi:hypothetical protein